MTAKGNITLSQKTIVVKYTISDSSWKSEEAKKNNNISRKKVILYE